MMHHLTRTPKTILRTFTCLAFLGALGAVSVAWYARRSLIPFPDTLHLSTDAKRAEISDRHGRVLSVTFANDFNLSQHTALREVPDFFRSALIESEDQRFYEHTGVDWWSRLHALWQNLQAGAVVRGASTLSEQVVRILHPRPRTWWSRLLEGVEATRLEERFSKNEILEFYLNQVPYARNRRGVLQAARYFFDRDLSTLSRKEMLFLVVALRAPSHFDRVRDSKHTEALVDNLAGRLAARRLLTSHQLVEVQSERLTFQNSDRYVNAEHFVGWVRAQNAARGFSSGKLSTTLDASLQRRVQRLLESRVAHLRERRVSDGAVLIANHLTGEILAWVNAGDPSSQVPGSKIDSILIPRQPGSTLKPFLYALALSKGWTAATLIDDSPITHAVGHGLHLYRNYSRLTYGALRLRLALANSLNIPAVKTVMFTGKEDFMRSLHELGFESLRQHPEFYGEGLALGNGEVTLFELVRAYATLASLGVYQPLHYQVHGRKAERRVFSEEVSSIITDILSDSEARFLEFGESDLLSFPVETAIKTGTSNDYTDAWAVGFSSKYVVGVWMGNLDRRPMLEVSGATGPALLLRSIFAELAKGGDTRPLRRSRNLIYRDVCERTGELAVGECERVSEIFVPGSEPVLGGRDEQDPPSEGNFELPRIELPTPGLQLALDPRIPDEAERFPFQIADAGEDVEKVQWLLDGKRLGSSRNRFLWQPVRGVHKVRARVFYRGGEHYETEDVRFYVK